MNEANANLQKELEIFKQLDEGDKGIFNMRWVSEHVKGGQNFETFIEQTLKLLMKLAEIIVMEGECTFERAQFQHHGIISKIKVTGDKNWTYCINVCENLAQQIEDGIAEENSGNLPDAIGQFAAISCNNAVEKLNAQKSITLSSPETVRQKPEEKFSFSENEQILYIPILVPEGKMDLIIAGTDLFTAVKE